MAKRYEVLSITLHGERLVESHDSQADAFDVCVAKWSVRKPAQPIYAVRDSETDERWSYRDIQELRDSDYSSGPKHSAVFV